MTPTEIEEMIIELLAADQKRDAGQLRQELEALGGDLPLDSLIAAEAMAAVEERCGVTMPVLSSSANLQSVRSCALLVHRIIEEQAKAASASEAP